MLAAVATSCHSDPAMAGEESRSMPQSVAEDAILRFAQDDKIGGLTQNRVTVGICHRI